MSSGNATTARSSTTTAGGTDVTTLTADSVLVRISGRDFTGQLEAWVTVDQAVPPTAATPSVGGDNVYWLGPRDTLVVQTPQTGPTTVRVMSTGAYPYHVSVT